MDERTVRMPVRRVVLPAALIFTVILPGACRKRRPEPKTRPAPATRPSQGAPPGQISPEALRKAEEATVFIESRYRPLRKAPEALEESDYFTSSGTGLIISRDGLILTNAHVVDPVQVFESEPAGDAASARRAAARRVYVLDAVEVWIHSGTPRTKRLRAQVLATREPPRDLALLRVRHNIPLLALPVADGLLDRDRRPTLRKTQRVWAVGFPLGRQVEEGLRAFNLKLNPNGPDLAARGGEVSALRHDDLGHVKAVEHSCDTEPGNSGGPLINDRGELVGVNTWGGPKMGYAIPLEIVLEEFASTLRLMGHRTADDGRPPQRKLIVEPSAAKDTGVVFRKLESAMAAARDGDIIELGEGEHKYHKDLVIDKSVWIRGAGARETRVRPAAGRTADQEWYSNRLDVRVAGYLEISDLDAGAGLRFEPVVGREAYIYRTHLSVTYVIDSSPNFTDCTCTSPDAYFNIRVKGGKARPKFQRVQSGFTIDSARPTILGCRCYFENIVDGAQPEVRGCYMGRWGLIRKAEGSYRYNFFPYISDNGLVVKEGSRVVVEGNRFEGAALHIYAGGSVVIRENCFEARSQPSVRVEEKAYVEIEGNYFYFPGLGPLPSEIARDPSLRAWSKGIPMYFVYGIAAKGKNVWGHYENNIFITRKTWARHISLEDGATLRDRGGNEVEMVSPTPGAAPVQ
ncbi:MAG: trypsin-like peptidase domain-containing protein [Planctomycetota bacterium]|jgi:S1-C subfamily serine protease